MLINTVHKVVHPIYYSTRMRVRCTRNLGLSAYVFRIRTYVHGLVNCVDKTCCILISVHIPIGSLLVDSLSLKTSQNFYIADIRYDIKLLSVLLRKQEELNSWILRLGKAGLVVTQIGVRCLQTSL